MAKVKYILFALALTGCSSTQIYVDDAYHWEDKTPSSSKTQATAPKTPSSSSPAPEKNPESTPAPETPTLEFLNVQDTTVTVRINR